MSVGMFKWRSNTNIIKMLLELVFQETFVMREEKREWDERRERMVSSLLRDFKCLEYGEYLMDEFRSILRKSEKEMKQVFHEAKFAMEAVMKLMPDASFSQSVSQSTVQT